MEHIWSSVLAVFAVAGAVLLLQKKSSRTSTSSSHPPSMQPLPAADYEVFLSFRGPDVRTTFTDFLYRYLDHSSIRTFIDEEELPKGEEIRASLVKAIQESKIYIPILSKDYASSKWCLQELALMVKCWKQGKGHLILPIFFLVNPREVRHQEGCYKKAFRRHSEKYDADTVNEWKEAMEEVGKMKGWHVTEADRQGAIVAEVFSMVRSHLMENYKLVTGQLVGIDPHIEQVKGIINKGVQIVGIQGMSGIGKTNIAKTVYDSVNAQFDRCCFVEDVRDILSKNDGVVTLQNKILSGILRRDVAVRDASQGIQKLKDVVRCSKSMLFVLDNIDEGFLFVDTLGDLTDFQSKCQFIITAVDERVFNFFQNYELYQPEGMTADIALKLFSRHAFGTDYPPQEYIDLSRDFVEIAAGLPLALKTTGSLLFRKDKSFWSAKLMQLQDIPPTKVQERLKIIYMDLTPEEKHIFLDIACYFIGEPYDRLSCLWSDSNLHPLIVIDTLCLKSLIKVNERNEFWMHDQYKILGRAIVREEDILNPWKRSRMWSNKDVVDMLRDKEGNERLEVLRVNMSGEDFELTEKEFQKLSGLRYLEVCFGKLTGDFKKILPNVRWLQLQECSSIPIDFNVKKLVILDLKNCPVRDDWRSWSGIKEACRLKAINMSCCNDMREVPNLFGCRNLEWINFRHCLMMGGELHIGNFKDLRLLHVCNTKITKLTGDIGRFQNLREIMLNDRSLREIPAAIGKLSSLENLNLLGLKIEVPELPTSLKRLWLSSPRVLNLLELKHLEMLSLNCDGLEITGDMSKLSKLKHLSLTDVGNGKGALVRRLGMRTFISSSPTFPSSLKTLRISGCQLLKRLPNFANLSNLMILDLSHFGVHEIAGLGELRMLEEFHLKDASKLTNLNGLEHLKLLEELCVSGCGVLRKLPSLSNLNRLRVLYIVDCPLLSEIQGLGGLADLSSLGITRCHQLTGLMGLNKLESLQELNIYDCASIKKLPDLSVLKHLLKLKITRCNLLPEVIGIERLESLYIRTLDERLNTCKGKKRVKRSIEINAD
ncbi:unnamed protein product [Linum trigynum]|uniref:TIR domain-containing protein n=1 Tax=Linum trigynum TaxID=586398 RepID=A0AAV2CQ25_9ROSI